jgi:hypothetical protein
MKPVVVTGFITIGSRALSLAPRNDERKRKRNAVRRCSVTTATCVAARTLRVRTTSGVPPQLLPEGVIVPEAQLGPGFSGQTLKAAGDLPASAGPGCSEHLARRS